MAALDPYAQPIDRTQQVQVDEFKQNAADIEAQRQQRALAMQGQQAALDQQTQTAASQKALQTAGGDAAQWAAIDPYKGKSWGELPPEARQHFQDAYPTIQSQIPGLFNQEAQTVSAPLKPSEKYQHVVNPTTGQMGVFNPATGEYTEAQTDDASSAGQSGNVDSIVHGFLRKQLPLSALPRSGPLKMAVLGKLTAADPNWTAQNYEAQQKARDSFVGQGRNAQAIVSMNTLIQHLGEVYDKIPGLQNTGTPGWNAIANTVAGKLGTAANKGISDFNNAADTASTEYARMLTGGVPTQGQIKEHRLALDSSQDPAVLKNNILTMTDLLGGRLRELQEEWKNTVGSQRDVPFLNKDTLPVLGRMGVNPVQIDPLVGGNVPPGTNPNLPPAANTPAQPPAVNSQQEYDALPRGAQYRDSTGRTATKK